MERQLTKDEAMSFYNAGKWESWSDEQIVAFQLYQELLCVDFDRYIKALRSVFNRQVQEWEISDGFYEDLREEYEAFKKQNQEAGK